MRPTSPPLRIAIGLAACVAIAIAARWLASLAGVGIETALALVLGLIVGSVPRVRPVTLAGARVAGRSALRIGVALLGARLTLGAVIAGGLSAVIGALIIVVVGLALGIALARRMAVPRRLGWLVAAGMAICGNSAILALSPVIRAEERETTYAVSTITVFGLASVIVLPILGHLLGLTDIQFGTWAGLAVNDTAQVVATGFAYSDPAGDVATIVKLTRNLAIAPVIIGAALIVPGARGTSTGTAVLRAIPWFVIGFLGFAAARSLGLLDAVLPNGATLAEVLGTTAGWLILIALAGVGLQSDPIATLRIGGRPFALAAIVWIVLIVLALGIAVVPR